MSNDLLKTLAARAQGRAPLARPALGPRFGPPPALLEERPDLVPAAEEPAREAAEDRLLGRGGDVRQVKS